MAAQAWLEAARLTGNPSGLHAAARRVRQVLEDARESIAADLGAHPTEVVFTSSATEADSIAVLGSAAARPERPVVAVGAIEHPGVLSVTGRIDQVRLLEVGPDGLVDPTTCAAVIAERTSVVSLQLVNGEVGARQPVEQVAAVARAAGAWMHTDAVQAMAWPGVDFDALGVDMASVSAHKIGGPVGIGALLVRRQVQPQALLLGAGQERGLTSGTQQAALAAGFAAALHELVEHRDTEVASTAAAGRRVRQIVEAIDGVQINGPSDPALRAPNIINVSFEHLRANDLLFLLDQAGIDASVGSACRAGLHQPSEVLLAMGADLDRANATVRFSVGHQTNPVELDLLAQVLPDAVARARTAW